MIKMKSNRALMASGLSLVLCLAMLIGTTFAWFSDSVSNKGNRIQAGKLAVGFTASNALENNDLGADGLGDLADESIKLFDLANWAPGDTYTRYMRVKNLGSLALKYNINFVLSGDNSLADAIKLDVTPAVNTPTVVNGSNVSAATAENIEMNGVLANADDFQIFKVELSFLESAGNTYQGGSFGLDVNLVATQNNANIITAKDASDFANVPANSTIVLQKDITTTETIAITEFVNIDLNGYTLTCKDFSIVKDDAIGTIDVANGKIVADSIKISAEKGSVNVSNLNGTISATGKVSLNGSMNTVNILKGTQFIISGTETPAPIEIQSETRVVVKTEESIKIAIPDSGKDIVIEDSRANVTTQTIAVEVPTGTTDVEIKNNPNTSSDNKIKVSGEGQYDIVEDNIDLKTQIRLTDMWSGVGNIETNDGKNSMFGYIQFRLNRAVDFTKATAKIDYMYRVNSGEYSLDKTSGKGKTKVTGNRNDGRLDYSKNEFWYSGMLNDITNNKKIEKDYMTAPANSLIATNDTSPKARYPEIYNAILATKGTVDTVEVITVLTIIDEYNAVQSWTFDPVSFKDGKAVKPGITPPVSK